MIEQEKYQQTLEALKKGKIFYGERVKLEEYMAMVKNKGESVMVVFEDKEYDDGKSRMLLKPIYKSGFIFKPDHAQIHYVKRTANLKRSCKYENVFTMDEHEAQLFVSDEQAKTAIDKVLPKPDNEYHYCAVIENTETGSIRKHIIW
ncbi:hypothetical protein VCRA2120O333_20059 [Vibrio crassostreae]|nr:hypothetical protein VCRA2121O334_20060 [Vibrio crassostreae]CAK3853363.1 hypothetical protein VCRA2120O333_20059 [Vibrio crassostreae]